MPNSTCRDGPCGLVPGDLRYPGGAWVHLPNHHGYDRFQEALIDEKEKLAGCLVMIVAERRYLLMIRTVAIART